MNALLSHRAAKPLIFLLALGPFAWLLYGALTNGLGPNPAEALMRGTGEWVLRFLCLTLAITPLRQISGWTALARLRRMLGLYAFFYGLVHLLCYAWLDMGFELHDILRDIPKRPFVLVGTLALLLMLPLAATSFNRAIRAIGSPRWRQLHRLIYAVVLLGLLHYFWMRSAKNDFGEVGAYAALVALLLGWRLWAAWRARSGAGRRPRAGLTS
jgi:sulfoxide reductase heme-binding subunit YedZ